MNAGQMLSFRGALDYDMMTIPSLIRLLGRWGPKPLRMGLTKPLP